MKVNKGKGLATVDEVIHYGDEVLIQNRLPAPSTLKLAPLASSEKRKTLSKKLDTGNLPSCRGNKKKNVDSLTPSTTPIVVLNPATPTAKPVVPKVNASLLHPNAEPSNPSLKAPHFDNSLLKNLAEELRADIVEKDTRLNHLQKQNDELQFSLSKSEDEVIKELKTFNEFTDLLDKNCFVGFEDFCMDTIEAFPRVDFDSIKLPTIAKSSLLQTSSQGHCPQWFILVV